MFKRQSIFILFAILMFLSLVGCSSAEFPLASQTNNPDTSGQKPLESSDNTITVETSETTASLQSSQTTFPIVTTTTTGTTTQTTPPDTTVPYDTTQTTTTSSYGSTSNTTTKPGTTTVPDTNVKLEVLPPDENLLGLSDAEVFAFFDDAVFVGDSVSLGWRNYVTRKRNTEQGFMGGAKFLVSGSLGAANSLWPVSKNSVHPTYQGEQMQLWKSIPLTGAKKLFIMLGLNDVGLYGIPNSANNYKQLINNIKAAVPDISIYIMSATYMYKGSERGKLTSENLRLLNKEMIKICRDNGYEFINIADPLSTPEGNLKPEYCSDKYVHQTDAAYQVWAKLLKGFAASQLKK